MVKLGKTAQIYSDKSLKSAMKEALAKYSEYLSDEDKAIFNNFDALVESKEAQIKEALLKIPSARVCSLTENRRHRLSINTNIIFTTKTHTDPETGAESSENVLYYGTEQFNGLPVFVTEKGRLSDIHYTSLSKILESEKYYPRGSYVLLEKHDLLSWLKLFEVGKVTNISKLIDEYKADVAAARKAARANRGPRVAIEYSKLPVFHIRGFGRTLYTFEDVEQKAKETGATIVYSVVKTGWDEEDTISKIKKPTTKEEERSFVIGNIGYIGRSVESVASAIGFDTSNYLFVRIEAVNYKKLKLWNATWTACDDFVKTILTDFVNKAGKIVIRNINGGIFGGVDREDAISILRRINEKINPEYKSYPFYAALTKNLEELSKDEDYRSKNEYQIIQNNYSLRYLFDRFDVKNPISKEEIDGSHDMDAYPLASRMSYRYGDIDFQDHFDMVIDYFASMDKLRAFEEAAASKAE
jgi:hypothetical protein